MKAAAPVTTFLSLLSSFFGAYVWLASRKKERSIRDDLIGQGIANPDNVVRILKTFDSDQPRLQALTVALGQDAELAKSVLLKVKDQLDISLHTAIKEKWRAVVLWSVAVVMIVLAVVGFFQKAEVELERKVTTMYSNFNMEQYAASSDQADEILRAFPDNFRALSIKGSLAFFEGRYADSVKYFRHALAAAPGNPTMMRNLADALVEQGQLTEAYGIYKAIPTSDSETHLDLARLLLFQHKFQQATQELTTVPKTFERGKALILKAAASNALAAQSSNERRYDLRKGAALTLNEGKAQDPEYWSGILSGTREEKKAPYARLLPFLVGIDAADGSAKGAYSTMRDAIGTVP